MNESPRAGTVTLAFWIQMSEELSNNPISFLSRNQRSILELIRSRGNVSRAELASELGFTPGAITRQIQELLALSLVQEEERRSGMRGQPALPISIKADAAFSIGLTFSLHEISAVAIDFRGKRVAELTRTFSGRSAAELTQECGSLVKELERSPALRRQRILGVGIAVPAYFQSDAPVVMKTFDALTGLANHDLDIFRLAVGHPTWIENNSTAAALAEYYSRLNRDVRNLVLINVGYGFSAGYVLDAHLYRGRRGNAGEIGRLFPRGTPRPSVVDLVNCLKENGLAADSMDDIAQRIIEASAPVTAWIERAGRQLREAIDLVHFVLAPDEVVLGGQIPHVLAQRLGVAIADATAPTDQPTPYRVSRLGPEASALGAAFLPIHQTSSPRLGQRRR